MPIDLTKLQSNLTTGIADSYRALGCLGFAAAGDDPEDHVQSAVAFLNDALSSLHDANGSVTDAILNPPQPQSPPASLQATLDSAKLASTRLIDFLISKYGSGNPLSIEAVEAYHHLSHIQNMLDG